MCLPIAEGKTESARRYTIVQHIMPGVKKLLLQGKHYFGTIVLGNQLYILAVLFDIFCGILFLFLVVRVVTFPVIGEFGRFSQSKWSTHPKESIRWACSRHSSAATNFVLNTRLHPPGAGHSAGFFAPLGRFSTQEVAVHWGGRLVSDFRGVGIVVWAVVVTNARIYKLSDTVLLPMDNIWCSNSS